MTTWGNAKEALDAWFEKVYGFKVEHREEPRQAEEIVFNEENSVEITIIETKDSVDFPGRQDWVVRYANGKVAILKGVYLRGFKDPLARELRPDEINPDGSITFHCDSVNKENLP